MPDLTPSALRAWREANGLTHQAAAQARGIPKRTYETLEYGRSPNSALWGPIARLVAILNQPQAPNSRLR